MTCATARQPTIPPYSVISTPSERDPPARQAPPMDKVLAQIGSGSPRAHLRHVDASEQHDASKPDTAGAHVGHWDKEALLKGIEQGVPLKHVDTVDKAKPVIEPEVHIGTNEHSKLMAEVQHAAVMREIKSGGGREALHHVDAPGSGAPANGN